MEKQHKNKQRYTHWQGSLQAVLKKHNAVSSSGAKTVSYSTQALRKQVLWQGFKELRELGYRLQDVRNFRENHLKALAHHWEAKGLSSARIQNTLSIFRTFSGWIGKRGMIRASHYYVRSPQSVTRSTQALTDKTWSGQGVRVDKKLLEVANIDARVAGVLQLQAAFALRMKEASLLRVHQADKKHYLLVNWGTKGGRSRVIPIENDTQRAALQYVKSLVSRQQGSLIPRDLNFKQWRNRFYYICRKADILKEYGLTSHGLRHERLNEIYCEKTGSASPIKGQHKGAVSKEADGVARQEVAEVAGHCRASIAALYLGGVRLVEEAESLQVTPDEE